MYIPPHFAEQRPEELHRLMRAHPLGMLVTHAANGLDANHIPFELEPGEGPHGTLRGHVARNNPVWREVADGSDVLVVFRGPEGYVSPNWYPTKHEAHRAVPTWNYTVVHVHGALAIRDDERYVRGVVARLTRTHEAPETKPWRMGDSAPDFIDQMVAAIVGIEVRIARIEGKFKLGQNREMRDRQGAADGLRGRGDDATAEAMEAAMR